MRCGAEIPEPVSSSTNVMRIILRTDGSVSHRGFNLAWSTDDPVTCGGVLTGHSGIISSPMDENYNYTNNVLCQWTLAPRQQFGTLKLLANQILLENTPNYCYDFLAFLRGDLTSGHRLGYHCGHIQTPTKVLSPGPEVVNVVFLTDRSITNKGFNISYSYNQCGGVLQGPYHEIRSSGANEDCVWVLNFAEGQQIELSRFQINMENSATIGCGQPGASFVIVRNGGEPDSPILWSGCGNTISSAMNSPIRSMSNKMWIESHLEGSRHSLSMIANAVQAGCGGILHGDVGNITGPLSDDGKYRNGVECQWVIESQPGFRIDINLYGRFDIEQTIGCTNDYLQVSTLRNLYSITIAS
jgi:cubilin